MTEDKKGTEEIMTTDVSIKNVAEHLEDVADVLVITLAGTKLIDLDEVASVSDAIVDMVLSLALENDIPHETLLGALISATSAYIGSVLYMLQDEDEEGTSRGNTEERVRKTLARLSKIDFNE